MITKTTKWEKRMDFQFQDWINGEKIDVLPQAQNKEYLTDFTILIEIMPGQAMDGYFTLRWMIDGGFASEIQLQQVIQTIPNDQSNDAKTIVLKMSDFKDQVVLNTNGTYALNQGLTLVPNNITQGSGKVRLKCVAFYESFYEN
jgi:hypothetical protein